MLDFLRKFLPKTDRPAPSAAGARGGFNYSGGPLFGPWDPSVHAAPGQYARFGRAAARPLSVFSKLPCTPTLARPESTVKTAEVSSPTR